jgi:hypothetical protein
LFNTCSLMWVILLLGHSIFNYFDFCNLNSYVVAVSLFDKLVNVLLGFFSFFLSFWNKLY